MFIKKIILNLMVISTILSTSCNGNQLLVGSNLKGNNISSPENSMFDYIKKIELDSKGNLYILDESDKPIKQFQYSNSRLKILYEINNSKNNIKLIKIDKNDSLNLLIDNKITKLDKNNNISILDVNKDSSVNSRDITSFYFGNQNDIYTYSNNDIFKYSSDLKEEKITIDINLSPFAELKYINFNIGKAYFIERKTNYGYLIYDSFYLYELNFKDMKNESINRIDEKYSISPYPSGSIKNITFDSDDNMYLYHDKCCITKTSSDGKYIKTYYLSNFQYLPYSINPIRFNINDITDMVVDSKNKLLY
ncbi:MAG: hypothetical protein ACK4IX_17030 [Candidatus Sericytochromatia bacterium]